MLAVDDWLSREGRSARLIMQVHDELVLEVPKDEIEAVRPAIIRIMESAATLSVPLRVDSGIGRNWDEAH
jgi:DNA polymerase-1